MQTIRPDLCVLADEPAQESGPEGGVEHQLEQRQHDGVAVADVETHLVTKITDGVDAADVETHLVRSGALPRLPGPAPPAEQRHQEERRPGEEKLLVIVSHC